MKGRVRRALPLLVLLVAVVGVVVVAGPPGQEGPPLDPGSTGPLGTKALIDTLRELGADVRVTDAVPSPDVATALLLQDDLDDAQHGGLRDWVTQGGRLILTDPTSELAPKISGLTQVGLLDPALTKRCDLAALRDVERVAGGGVVYSGGETRCFPRNRGAWLVAKRMGDGVVVALGGPTVFVNERLGTADNALLATSLLAPGGRGVRGSSPGTARVTILRPAKPGEGDASLTDLLPPRVRAAFVQLGVAFALVVAWRARRLGRPVLERTPVRIPGSELVIAVGNLLQQTRGRRRSAALLRADLRRTLTERLGLPPSTPSDAVAAAVAARVDAQEVRSALDGPDPATDEDLVRLARAVEGVRQALLEGHARVD
ncbi:MAG: DUF4350 domain-containing protein [Egibacteraceae bacterium]